MILRRTNDNYAKKSLRIWSTVKVSWVRRRSRNAVYYIHESYSANEKRIANNIIIIVNSEHESVIPVISGENKGIKIHCLGG